MNIDRLQAQQESLERYGQPRPLISAPCSKCDKSTPHRGRHCLYCGTLYLVPPSRSAWRPSFNGPTRKQRIAEQARQAAQSRAKWEGKP
jgi:hypothetical protein